MPGTYTKRKVLNKKTDSGINTIATTKDLNYEVNLPSGTYVIVLKSSL